MIGRPNNFWGQGGGLGMLRGQNPGSTQPHIPLPHNPQSQDAWITPGAIKPPQTGTPPHDPGLDVGPQQQQSTEPQFLPMGNAPLAARGRYRIGGGAWQMYGDDAPYWSSGEMFQGRQLNPNWRPPVYPQKPPVGPADMGIGSGNMTHDAWITPGAIKPPQGGNPGGGMIVPPVGGGGWT